MFNIFFWMFLQVFALMQHSLPYQVTSLNHLLSLDRPHLKKHIRPSLLIMSDPIENFGVPSSFRSHPQDPSRSHKFCSPKAFLFFLVFAGCLFRCTCAALNLKYKSQTAEREENNRKVQKYTFHALIF